MHGLAGIVSDECNGGGERAELSFRSEVEGWETLSWGEDFAEMVAG